MNMELEAVEFENIEMEINMANGSRIICCGCDNNDRIVSTYGAIFIWESELKEYDV